MTDNNLVSGVAGSTNQHSRPSPSFSVITITWNDRAGLIRTIESLKSQTEQNVEHIIIDGASSDGTREVLASYAADFPVIKISEPDNGIYDAMNKGTALATGDLVVFMNSGDVFGSVDSLAFVRDEYIAGQWRWGFGCMRYVDDTGRRFSGRIQAPLERQKLFLGLKFVPHQAMYMELSFLRELGPFSLDLGIAADQDMAIRATLASEPAVWVEFLTDFLVGGAHSTISRWRREYIYHQIRARQDILVYNNRMVDLSITSAIAVWRSTRDRIARIVRYRKRLTV